MAENLLAISFKAWQGEKKGANYMAIVEESEYKGNPLLVLKNNPDDRYPFSFGIKKAKLIIEHFEDIKKFVEKNDKEKIAE